MARWKLPLLLIAILLCLQYMLWFGKNNVFDYYQAQQNVAEMSSQNEQLRLRNEKMFAETSDLYNGREAIEERARDNLGMIKPGEHFYRIIPESGRSNGK